MLVRTLRKRRRGLLQLAALISVLLGAWALREQGAGLVGAVWDAIRAVALWLRESPPFAAAVYVLSTAAAKLIPFTGGGLIVLAGGYLFGTVQGGLLAALGTTFAALLVYIAGRLFLSDLVLDRWGERLARFEERVAADGFSYLLAVRLLPIVPAWLSNLLPVAFPVRLRTVLTATFLGVLPISFIMAGVGNSLSQLSRRQESLSARLLLEPDVLLPLAGLALLALLPVVLRRFVGGTAAHSRS